MMNSNMLHNTGPYGSNESSVNVGAPEISELATPMNIAQNFNNIVKMSQQTAHSPSGHFNFHNYPGFASSSISSNAQFNMFPSNHFQSSSATPTTSFLHSLRQNGSVPDHFHFNRDIDHEVMDFSSFAHKIGRFGASTDNIKMQHSPLNVPQIADKNNTNQKPVDSYPNHYNKICKNDNLFAPWKNLNHKYSYEQSSEKKDVLQPSNTENILRRESSGSENFETNDNWDKKESQSDNVVNTEDTKGLLSQDSDNSNASHKGETPKVLETNDNSNDRTTEGDNDSDSDDSKPLNLCHYIKQEPIEQEEVEVDAGTIVVKIEPISSWTDTEHMQPFLKDTNGVGREDSSLDNLVDCTNSIAKAKEIIKNGLQTDMGFECPDCCLIFRHPKRFLIHTKWHAFGLTNDRRIEEAKEKIACRQQKKEMKNMIKKEAAELSKKDEPQVFSCKNCDKAYNTKSKLRNHRHKYHSSREHQCKVCQTKVLGWFGLQTHMATHNKDLFECDICSKAYKHAHSLSKHRDSHLEKTHPCSECPKKFGSQKLLKIHMKSHERAQRGRTFRCSYCAKGFYEAYTLQYHERTHRNERPFKCEICDTSYGTNSSLKRHLKVSHSDAKPFKCGTCHRCFSTALIRDRHAARAHGTPGELHYACTQCTSRYMRLKDLQRHMYRIHPKGKKRRKDSDSE
ncbi:hypothetical protein evm_003732 [Chilo suppressalis]|nr:hypothetical protein evm_003732 [Chilo suppressalis]